MTVCNTLLDLPLDMLRNIMLCVEGHSVKDFIKMKLCCTQMKALGEEPYMLQSISLRGLPNRDWHRRHEPFLQTCLANNNPEALYRAGVNNYFEGQSVAAVGLVQLVASSDANHLFATYTLAVLLIFNWDADVHLVEEGFRRLSIVCAAGKELQCRRKFAENAYRLWPDYNSVAMPPLPQTRCSKNHKKSLFLWTEEYLTFEDPCCMDCRCDAEVDGLLHRFEWRHFPERRFK